MHKITLIPGDGIGPEVVAATTKIIDAVTNTIEWDVQNVTEEDKITNNYDHILNSIKQNKVALKGPITTPVGEGYKSINVYLRKALDLFANVRPIKQTEGIVTRFSDVKIDMVVIRENTEDLYLGIEHMVGDDAAESIKLFTKKGCERIARFAFEYAKKYQRKKVTVIHKANIMKLTDGMFLNEAKKVSEEYPEIAFEPKIIDAMCMELILKPERFDILLCPNFYGDIISDLCAGLIGGLGLAEGANISHDFALFEPVHGSAPDIAGKNLANPLATLFSAINMLRYIGETDAAEKIDHAVKAVLKEGLIKTGDIGGTATTDQFADYIISKF